MRTPVHRLSDMVLTAMAPLAWGSTYLVTTQFLPPDRPLTAALLRVLPVGLLMLLWRRDTALGDWLSPRWAVRLTVLGLLNIGGFQALLFVGAYRLPGGVAATVGAVQPLLVAGLAGPLLGIRAGLLVWVSGGVGMAGVALLVLTAAARLDTLGVAASLGGAGFMALGTVLARRWQAPAPVITLTAWQLVIGGLILLPLAATFDPPLPDLSPVNLAGYAYLGLIGSGVAYVLWFRGVKVLLPSTAASLGLLSPLSATLLGTLALGEGMSVGQVLGAMLVLSAVWLGGLASRKA